MLLFAGPMILGNLLQQCYNIVDMLIVGRALGTGVLAAVGSGSSWFCLQSDDIYTMVYKKCAGINPAHFLYWRYLSR